MSTSVSRRSSATTHPTRLQLDELDALLKRMLDLPVHRLDDEAEDEGGSTSAPEPMRGPHRVAPDDEADESTVNYQTNQEDEPDLKPRVVSAGPDAQEGEQPAAVESAPSSLPETTAIQPGDAEDWVPLTSTWKPTSRTWKPLSEAWRQAQVVERPAAASPAARPEPSPFVDLIPTPTPEYRASQDEATSASVGPNPPAPPAEITPPDTTVSADPSSVPDVQPSTPARWTPRFLWPLVLFNILFDVLLLPWGAPGRWLRGRGGRWLLAVVGVFCLAAAGVLAAADWFGWTW
jgi:hypothetical protein